MSASDYTNANCSQDYYDPWCAAYEHEGMYSELQIGPALTQRHTFALPANSSFEWTEWFKGWQADPNEMHAADYSRPLAAANAWRASADAPSQATIDDTDAFLARANEVSALEHTRSPIPLHVCGDRRLYSPLHTY